MNAQEIEFIVTSASVAAIGIIKACLHKGRQLETALDLIRGGLPVEVASKSAELRDLQMSLLYAKPPEHDMARTILREWLKPLGEKERLGFFQIKQNGASASFGLYALNRVHTTVEPPDYILDIAREYDVSICQFGRIRGEVLTTAICERMTKAAIDLVRAGIRVDEGHITTLLTRPAMDIDEVSQIVEAMLYCNVDSQAFRSNPKWDESKEFGKRLGAFISAVEAKRAIDTGPEHSVKPL